MQLAGITSILWLNEAEIGLHSQSVTSKVLNRSNLHDAALFLDKFYIPARYPNGWGEGTPADYISKGDADNAIDNSEKIIRFCEGLLS